MEERIKKIINIKKKPRFSLYGFDISIPIKDKLNVKNVLELGMAWYVSLTVLVIPAEYLTNPAVQMLIATIGAAIVYLAISFIEFYVSEVEYLEFDEDSKDLEYEEFIEKMEDSISK